MIDSSIFIAGERGDDLGAGDNVGADLRCETRRFVDGAPTGQLDGNGGGKGVACTGGIDHGVGLDGRDDGETPVVADQGTLGAPGENDGGAAAFVQPRGQGVGALRTIGVESEQDRGLGAVGREQIDVLPALVWNSLRWSGI